MTFKSSFVVSCLSCDPMPRDPPRPYPPSFRLSGPLFSEVKRSLLLLLSPFYRFSIDEVHPPSGKCQTLARPRTFCRDPGDMQVGGTFCPLHSFLFSGMTLKRLFLPEKTVLLSFPRHLRRLKRVPARTIDFLLIWVPSNLLCWNAKRALFPAYPPFYCIRFTRLLPSPSSIAPSAISAGLGFD